MFVLYLKHSNRLDENYMANIRYIANTRYGVNLALEDFNIFGGNTRGASTIILFETEFDDTNDRLLDVVESNLSKRLAAIWVLWNRTHNDEYLVKLFELIRCPNHKSLNTTLIARYMLADISTNDVFIALLRNTDKSSPIDMSTNEFIEQLRSGILGIKTEGLGQDIEGASIQ